MAFRPYPAKPSAQLGAEGTRLFSSLLQEVAGSHNHYDSTPKDGP